MKITVELHPSEKIEVRQLLAQSFRFLSDNKHALRRRASAMHSDRDGKDALIAEANDCAACEQFLRDAFHGV
jgi:hypothetical protein